MADNGWLLEMFAARLTSATTTAAPGAAAAGTARAVAAALSASAAADAGYLVLYACLFSSYVLSGLGAIASD